MHYTDFIEDQFESFSDELHLQDQQIQNVFVDHRRTDRLTYHLLRRLLLHA